MHKHLGRTLPCLQLRLGTQRLQAQTDVVATLVLINALCLARSLSLSLSLTLFVYVSLPLSLLMSPHIVITLPMFSLSLYFAYHLSLFISIWFVIYHVGVFVYVYVQCLGLCLSRYPSISRSISLTLFGYPPSIALSLSLYGSHSLSIYLSLYISLHLSLYLCRYLSSYASLSLCRLCLCIHLRISLLNDISSLHVSISLSLCSSHLFVYVHVSVYVFVLGRTLWYRRAVIRGGRYCKSTRDDVRIDHKDHQGELQPPENTLELMKRDIMTHVGTTIAWILGPSPSGNGPVKVVRFGADNTENLQNPTKPDQNSPMTEPSEFAWFRHRPNDGTKQICLVPSPAR